MKTRARVRIKNTPEIQNHPYLRVVAGEVVTVIGEYKTNCGKGIIFKVKKILRIPSEKCMILEKYTIPVSRHTIPTFL